MSEYERSAEIPAPPDEVFRFVSNPANLPRFLAPMQSAEKEPGDRLHVRGTAEGHPFEVDTQFRTDAARLLMEWSAESLDNYHGWLQVQPQGGDRSRVTVHLSMTPRETGTSQQTAEHDRTVTDTMDQTLNRIKDLVGSGK